MHLYIDRNGYYHLEPAVDAASQTVKGEPVSYVGDFTASELDGENFRTESLKSQERAQIRYRIRQGLDSET